MSAEKKFLPTFNVFNPEDTSKEAFIHWTDNNGKRHRKKGGINRLKTVGERLTAANALIEKLRTEYRPAMTIGERMLAWADSHEGHWKKKTHQTIRSRIACMLEWMGPRQLTNDSLRDFFADLARRRHARTHNEYLYLFKRIFKDFEMPEILKGIDSVKAISTPAKYFQKHQIILIKKDLMATNPTLWLACEFIYYCFIRPGELRLMKVGDIHFDEWKICVRSAISKNKKEQYVKIPLGFRPSILRLKSRPPSEYIFYWKHPHEPLPVNSMQKKFRKVLKKLGFGLEYKFYSWKHTGAVAVVKSGVRLKHLQVQLRHHSLEEVDRYISQFGVDDLDDLSEKFPAI